MKVFSEILLTFAALFLLSSCGGGHSEQDGHIHEERAPEEEPHGEGRIATLTEAQVKAVGITLGDIEQKDLTATVKANGILRVPNLNKAHITSLYGGVIQSLKIEMGDYVKKGQPIATLAHPQFIQLQEEYLTLDSRIILAEQEYERQKELNQGHAGAVKNLQLATSEINTLRTRKASLQKQLRMMGINPADVNNSALQSTLVVTSPISGTVSNIFTQIGSYVDVSSPVAEIVDNSALHLDLQVFEKDLPKIKVGQTIHFMITNNPADTYTARVYSIGSAFENASKTIAVHSTVIGRKSGLIDGMNITGTVSLSDVRSMAVPDAAITEADGKYYVFIQSQEHEDHDPAEEHTLNFEKIEVIKGVSDMGYTAITPVNDIPAGAKIVTRGAFFINAKLSNTGGHSH